MNKIKPYWPLILIGGAVAILCACALPRTCAMVERMAPKPSGWNRAMIKTDAGNVFDVDLPPMYREGDRVCLRETLDGLWVIDRRAGAPAFITPPKTRRCDRSKIRPGEVMADFLEKECLQ